MNPDSKKYFRYFTYIQPVLKIPIVKTYGSVILTLLVTAIFILFAIKPTVETILTLQKKLIDSREVLAKISKKSQDLSTARNNYIALDSGVKLKIQQAIPQTPTVGDLIQTLEGAAAASQASISALQIHPVSLEPTLQTRTKALAELTFNFNVEGSFSSLTEVLRQLQSSDRLISLTNLVFNKNQEGSSIILSITGKAFYLR